MSKEFADKAKKLKEKTEHDLGGNEDINKPKKGFLDNAKELNAKMYAQAELVPMIDNLAANHIEGQVFSETEVKQFYTDVLNKLKKDGHITEQEAQEFEKKTKVQRVEVQKGKGFLGTDKHVTTEISGPSKLDDAIKATQEILNDSKLQPNLSTGEKLMFKLGKFCEDLGLSSISKACMGQIKPENLEKINKLENVLAGAVKIVSNIGKNQPVSRGDKTESILADRTQKRGGSFER